MAVELDGSPWRSGPDGLLVKLATSGSRGAKVRGRSGREMGCN